MTVLKIKYNYKVCHGFRLTKQDYYFPVEFDQFYI